MNYQDLDVLIPEQLRQIAHLRRLSRAIHPYQRDAPHFPVPVENSISHSL